MEQLHSLKIKKSILKTEKYWIETSDCRMLDVLCGNTAFIFGYTDTDILNSMYELQSKIGFLKDSSNETCDEHELLKEKIFNISGMAGICWAVSGSDAVESAIYANDLYWKSLNIDKPTILVFDPCYHGATYLERIFRKEYINNARSISVSRSIWNNISDREDFEKEYINQIRNVLTTNSKIGGLLMESCPWIEGLRPWSENFWKQIEFICREFKINFIVDDVFGGAGKQSHYFSHRRYDVTPDIVAMGKSITGGYTPLSFSCFSQKISDVVSNHWDYSHTWNPSMPGIGAALTVINKFDQYNFLEKEIKLKEIAQQLKEKSLIKNFISQGLMMELELSEKYHGEVLYKHGLNGNLKQNNSIFICIPIIADDEYFYELESRLTAALYDKI
jgi:adenosylmethionine-8-amino-7-oxononanoate aminotransferase